MVKWCCGRSRITPLIILCMDPIIYSERPGYCFFSIHILLYIIVYIEWRETEEQARGKSPRSYVIVAQATVIAWFDYTQREQQGSGFRARRPLLPSQLVGVFLTTLPMGWQVIRQFRRVSTLFAPRARVQPFQLELTRRICLHRTWACALKHCYKMAALAIRVIHLAKCLASGHGFEVS